jgi:hypothetical protein
MVFITLLYTLCFTLDNLKIFRSGRKTRESFPAFYTVTNKLNKCQCQCQLLYAEHVTQPFTKTFFYAICSAIITLY